MKNRESFITIRAVESPYGNIPDNGYTEQAVNTRHIIRVERVGDQCLIYTPNVVLAARENFADVMGKINYAYV